MPLKLWLGFLMKNKDRRAALIEYYTNKYPEIKKAAEGRSAEICGLRGTRKVPMSTTRWIDKIVFLECNNAIKELDYCGDFRTVMFEQRPTTKVEIEQREKYLRRTVDLYATNRVREVCVECGILDMGVNV